MTFAFFADDKLAVRYDQITAVRSLTEEDIDPRTGNLRSGIPADAVTEVVTQRGTYYTTVPFDDFLKMVVELEKHLNGVSNG